MRRLFIILALLLAAIFVVPAQAQAAPQGWTPKICVAPPGEDAKICTNMYIDSSSNVNWVQICSTRTQGYSYQGTRNNGGHIRNANYYLWGPIGLANTAENECKSYSTGGIHVGNNAWLFLSGTVHEVIFSDANWQTCQYVTGGAC